MSMNRCLFALVCAVPATARDGLWNGASPVGGSFGDSTRSGSVLDEQTTRHDEAPQAAVGGSKGSDAILHTLRALQDVAAAEHDEPAVHRTATVAYVMGPRRDTNRTGTLEEDLDTTTEAPVTGEDVPLWTTTLLLLAVSGVGLVVAYAAHTFGVFRVKSQSLKKKRGLDGLDSSSDVEEATEVDVAAVVAAVSPSSVASSMAEVATTVLSQAAPSPVATSISPLPAYTTADTFLSFVMPAPSAPAQPALAHVTSAPLYGTAAAIVPAASTYSTGVPLHAMSPPVDNIALPPATTYASSRLAYGTSVATAAAVPQAGM
eukprot:TRINITY_DN91211_c0_g1_i1.p1 TRINITY_DN91211_c0_g1~~TRINITY_DN91211_c0_g1_i1.p1  ORF type:complete len:318 (-),score=47.12 TRINITY_DN91211_c0_g1_i1:407-1360(-)